MRVRIAIRENAIFEYIFNSWIHILIHILVLPDIFSYSDTLLFQGTRTTRKIAISPSVSQCWSANEETDAGNVSPLKAARASTSPPSCPVTLSACLAFRFVSLSRKPMRDMTWWERADGRWAVPLTRLLTHPARPYRGRPGWGRRWWTAAASRPCEIQRERQKLPSMSRYLSPSLYRSQSGRTVTESLFSSWTMSPTRTSLHFSLWSLVDNRNISISLFISIANIAISNIFNFVYHNIKYL